MLIVLLETGLLIANLYVLAQHAQGLARVIPASCAFLSLFALFGPVVWDWSRTAAGIGLLGFWAMSQEEIAQFKLIMLFYTCGASLGNIYLINMKKRHQVARISVTIQNRRTFYLFNLSGMTAYLIGQGTNILFRESYLVGSGIGIMQRIASTILLPLLAASMYLMITSKTRREVIPAIALQTVWATLLLGVGSRSSLIAIIALFLVIVGRLRNRFFKATTIVILVGIVIPLTFGATQLARRQQLGVLRIPNLLSEQVQLFFADGVQYFTQSFKLILSSVLTSVPIVANSYRSSSFDLILQNFNPLIGSGTDAFTFSSDYAERLFPYIWVPLATAGQLYGGLGPVGELFFVGMISLMSGRILTRTASTTFESLIQLITAATFTAMMMLGIQYSSRIWLRLSWTIISFFIFALYLQSKRQVNLQSKRQVNLHHHTQQEVKSNLHSQVSKSEVNSNFLMERNAITKIL
jgi:hypothetical protein